MRIAFTGKGGSGKTTLASLFAKQMAQDGLTVLALDADINQHLGSALDVAEPLVSMGREFEEIKRYLKGANSRFALSDMHKTTPPGRGSQFVRLVPDDWFLRTYARLADGVYVAGAGDIPEGNIGVRCYHGLNGAVELVLGHLADGGDDIAIVDMTAGADAFSSALFTKVDALVLVVEPTLKSLSVYEQFKSRAAVYNVPLLVVGNKIEEEADKAFILDYVPELVAWFESSRYVRQRERGLAPSFSQLDGSFQDQLRTIRAVVASYSRDWDEMERRSHKLHLKNAAHLPGVSKSGHIDTEFSLKRAMEALD